MTETRRKGERQKVCERLKLDANKPLVLVSGGGEGLGKIERIVESLFELDTQIIVLCRRGAKLKNACEKLAGKNGNLRVSGWTENVAGLYQAADVLVSKLGVTFYEAMTCGLPVVALPPPPGAERAQYNLLENFGVGRAVKDSGEMKRAVSEILSDTNLAGVMRENARKFSRNQAAPRIAAWLAEKIYQPVL